MPYQGDFRRNRWAAWMWVFSAALIVSGLNAGSMVAQAPTPYLFLVTPPGPPLAATVGDQVTAIGSGFCQGPGCGTVVISFCADPPHCKNTTLATKVEPNADGNFSIPFTVPQIKPQYYQVEAQESSGGRPPITAATRLLVANGDPAENFEIQSPVLSAAPALLAGPLDPPPGASGFQPNIANGGRSVSVDVSPSNTNVAIAATESGGLFLTSNAGANWTHVDSLLTFRTNDVRYAPGNSSIVLVSSDHDSQVVNGGGIWRSADGGATWSKPTGADPTCTFEFNTYGIGFAPSTNNVYVGNDCGLAISHDLGATFTQVVPDIFNPTVFTVVAQPGPTGDIVDICTFQGHHRSTNGGMSFGPLTSLPGCSGALALSPFESTVVFAVGPAAGSCRTGPFAVYEGDYATNGTVTWTQISPPQCGSRSPWVRTHPSSDLMAGHFDIYFGSGLNLFRETCTNTGGPGNRCPNAWTGLSIDHSDQNFMAYNSGATNCAEFVVSDGGVHGTSDCGKTWKFTGGGTGGYNALQLYDVAGQVHPGPPSPTATDMYIGTMDNNLWASGDNGVTWPNAVSAEGFFITTPHSAPDKSTETVTGVACFGCGNFQSAADFTSEGGWNNPPGGQGNPFSFIQGVHVQWSSTTPGVWQLYTTPDNGTTWNPVSGGSTTLSIADIPHIAGPASNPTIYQAIIKPGNVVGLIQITGVLGGSASIASADVGLGNIGSFCHGQGTWVCPAVYGVDIANPLHLIAPDSSTGLMMVTTNGGLSWTPDMFLTNLVTQGNHFMFSVPSFPGVGPGMEPHVIAFDPANSNIVLVGTDDAGTIASLDNGAHWGVVPNSTQVTASSDFFFDEVQGNIFESTYGRGLWQISLVPADVSITKTGSAGSAVAGTNFTYTILVSNNGPTDATGVVVTDTLPFGVSFVSSSIACTNNSGTLTCPIGGLTNGTATSFTVTISLPSSGVGSPSITNMASVALDQYDPNLANNSASLTTPVVFVADLATTKRGTPNPAPAGTDVTYTIGVSNAGPSDANNTVVTDTLPPGVNFVGSSPVACTGTTVLTCNLGTLVNGATTSFTVTISIPANYLSSRFERTAMITETATVASSATDPNLSNNTASVSTTVIQVADVGLVVTEAPNPVVEGSTVTYTLTFNNTGPSDAPFAQILQYFPAGFVFAGSTYGTCSPGTKDVVCSLGPDMPVGYTQTFTIKYKVPAKFLGTATSKTVTSQSGISSQAIDPDPPDSTNIVSTTVIK